MEIERESASIQLQNGHSHHKRKNKQDTRPYTPANLCANSKQQKSSSRQQIAERREQGAEKREQGAESRQQRTESREQKAGSKEQRADTRGYPVTNSTAKILFCVRE
jgi:hypothetical protein